MSGILGRIDSIVVEELMDYSTYAVPEVMHDIMGFGQPPDAPVPLADPELAGSAFRAPLLLVADGLDAEIERFDYHREVAVAHEPITAKFGTIDPGTVSAQRFSCTAVIGGRPTLTIEHITRVGTDQAPDWPTGRGWRITVEGEPSMILDATIAVHGEDDTQQGCLGTAMHAVHAIAAVCAAPPGIRTFPTYPSSAGEPPSTHDPPDAQPLTAGNGIRTLNQSDTAAQSRRHAARTRGPCRTGQLTTTPNGTTSRCRL
jgi:2,4-diaminopentanoate dehydrogenase